MNPEDSFEKPNISIFDNFLVSSNYYSPNYGIPILDLMPIESLPPCPIQVSKRIVGKKYRYRNKIIIWDGKNMRCVTHNIISSDCIHCGGYNICIHGKRKVYCRLCGGGGLCPHSKQKSRCRECYGGSICEHGRRRVICKPCKGSQICEHNRIKYDCKVCFPPAEIKN